MYIDNVNLNNDVIDFTSLNEIMDSLNFNLGSHWDYERLVYDYKFVTNFGTYYLRVPGLSIDGDIGSNEALIKLKDPYIGKYYFNHGLEYGDDEYYPNQIINSSKDIVSKLESKLKKFNI